MKPEYIGIVGILVQHVNEKRMEYHDMFKKPTLSVRIGNSYRRFKWLIAKKWKQFWCGHKYFIFIFNPTDDESVIQCKDCEAFRRVWIKNHETQCDHCKAYRRQL